LLTSNSFRADRRLSDTIGSRIEKDSTGYLSLVRLVKCDIALVVVAQKSTAEGILIIAFGLIAAWTNRRLSDAIEPRIV
jgi:hypothetical protein